MRSRVLCLAAAVFVFGVVSIAGAVDPLLIGYQGVLTDNTGTPVPDGDYAITFRLYTDSTGDERLWAELHPAVEVKDGIFDVRLGSNSLLDIVVMRMGLDPSPFLEIAVRGEEPMMPRSRLLWVPQTMVAARLQGDVETREGSLLMRTTTGEPAIRFTADSLTDAIRFEIGTTLYPFIPAIGMQWDPISGVTQMKLGHPTDATAPAIELVTRPAGPWINEAKIHVGDLDAPDVDIGVGDAGGRIGLNLNGAAPWEAIHVSGNVRVAGLVCADNVACPSDARLKENVATIPDALARVERLCGVRFNWTPEAIAKRHLPDRPQIGLVAQEVRDVVPEAVLQMGDGYYAVDYSRLVPVLIEAIKERQREIDALDKRLSDLEGEM